jgi:hypothetical protein
VLVAAHPTEGPAERKAPAGARTAG